MLVVGNGVVLVGMGERTTPQGVENVAHAWFASGEVRMVIALELPRERAFMHLDTAMTMVDADAFSMYPYLPDEPRAWVLTPGDPSAAAEGVAGDFRVEEVLEPFRVLADALGLEKVRILRAPIDLRGAQREHHPTVGCAFVLASIGDIPLRTDETRIILEEGVGPVAVLIRSRREAVFVQLTAARLPEIKDPPPPPETLCEVLSLEPSHIVADDMIEPEAVSCGVPFLFIPLKKPEMLSWVKVDVAQMGAGAPRLLGTGRCSCSARKTGATSSRAGH